MATVCSMLDSRLSDCNDIVTTGAYSAEELLQATRGLLFYLNTVGLVTIVFRLSLYRGSSLSIRLVSSMSSSNGSKTFLLGGCLQDFEFEV